MRDATIGVDYSMSSPSVCVSRDGKIQFFYVNANEKLCHSFEHGNVSVIGIHYNSANINNQKKVKLRERHTDTERFITLSLIFDKFIGETETEETAVFEAYAFGAKGRLAQIGENTGTLKAVLKSKGYKIETISPTTVKKYAFGSGKAEKTDMADMWFAEFGFHVHEYLACDKGASPASDVIDSYYVLEAWKNAPEDSEEKG
ncbi:putative crossover junction endodeoxyribonuclease protein [Rhizobium phage RHph_I46]|uniref:Putative crossover junction endodeoxyribonuclease protein n=1 Tax=Rhizobium phage RHph_I1_9 TaxID=2509729 RepID=A0A7S5UZM8_9CAUD|nr:RuvC-like Holliday junction resolvase [Rhizobium phage RHph_I1_9]QIG69701.1 putative crossover junction endodeoxyribonuclease protein [Rhizobium phage RHph_I46]QIG70982.1 putative crossover junction endodeoxyribonuclease protein [Rhizobium phage RHph_I9]QIG73568.1 putative crossover junction endodeoxyribonuclease protein [Rhizobium phage RHph_I1_9]QIG76321.1 putative crossover junction endodeoxyribonuclease protein [Rhizobium phage RHph_I34]